jgi:hypothetical protein
MSGEAHAMIVGFTGTRKGITDAQQGALDAVLVELCGPDDPPPSVVVQSAPNRLSISSLTVASLAPARNSRAEVLSTM